MESVSGSKILFVLSILSNYFTKHTNHSKNTIMAKTKLTGAELIARERQRQIDQEGFSAAHDRGHIDFELAHAAIAYANPNRRLAKKIPGDERYPNVPTVEHTNSDGEVETCLVLPESFWPFDINMWKPSPDDRVRELVKAGALFRAESDRMAAEIDRLLAEKNMEG